jgi:NADPH:quinone reductase-like Zn-dependent oxidoreductase
MKTFVPRWLGGRFRSAHLRPEPGWPIDGMLSEYVVLHEDAVLPVPANLDLLEAATLPVAALTAWSALTSCGGLKPGDSVLTLGSGGVSVFALRLAKLFGAWVAATTSTADKAARLAALGADTVINVRHHPEWASRVLELTGGRGVDRVIEIGGSATLSRSLRALAMGGHVCMVGFVAGAGLLDPTEITGKNIVTVQAAGGREQFEDLTRAIEHNDLHPTIDLTFARSQISQAYVHLASGNHIGKVVIDHAQL